MDLAVKRPASIGKTGVTSSLDDMLLFIFSLSSVKEATQVYGWEFWEF
ncbi:MAG: hypothetical protein WBA76_04520 [Phormidesmis sp.]